MNFILVTINPIMKRILYMVFFRKHFQGGRRLELKYIKLILMYFAASAFSAYSNCLISHSAEKSTWRSQSFISNENCIGIP